MPNLEIKNIRYRYPICSEAMMDMMDMIYWNLVELLGYTREDGTISPSGLIWDQYNSLDDVIDIYTGVQTSGMIEPLSIDDGLVNTTMATGEYISNYSEAILGNWRHI